MRRSLDRLVPRAAPWIRGVLACALGAAGSAQPPSRVELVPPGPVVMSVGEDGIALEQFVRLACELTRKKIEIPGDARAAAAEVSIKWPGAVKVEPKNVSAFFREMLVKHGFATVVRGEGKDERIEVVPIAKLPADERRELPREGVVTLFADDPVRQTFGFSTAGYGRVIQDRRVLNRNGQLALGKNENGEDALLFGWQGGERAFVIDVGDPRDEQTGVSLFDRFTREAVRARVPQAEDGAPSPRMPIEDGHVYLVRIDDPQPGYLLSKGETLFARVRVLDHVPGRSLTVGWALLDEPVTDGAKK